MRIIAGKHRSRQLETLEGLETRPMMDRMKESVFNIIGPYFENVVVLDLFGGCGALSLEALSRGAKQAYINDISKSALKVINFNVNSLNEKDRTVIMNFDYLVTIKKLETKKFDLIFLDPPFKMNIINEIIDLLLTKNMINTGGYIICQAIKGRQKISDQLSVIKNYCFGNNEVIIYQK